ncbi:MAG: helix-turn-helix domain-containing protein [Sphingomonas fennica]
MDERKAETPSVGLAAWNAHFSGLCGAATFMPVDPAGFRPTLASHAIGALHLARLACQRATIARAAPRGHPRGRRYDLLVLRSGRATLDHFGRTASLGPGDSVLCDGNAPLGLVIEAEAELMILQAPAALLNDHLPSPEHHCGRVVAAAAGLAAPAAAVMASLAERMAGGGGLPMADRVARHLLDMIATSYAMAFDPIAAGSSIVSSRFAAIKLFIEQHLRDPDFGSCAVAERLKLSPRYVRTIFAANDETVSGYILRRRLEECARQIADPHWRGHSITEIAFGWGFNSAPHFTRSFRDQFGTAPRDYRRDHQTHGPPRAPERRVTAQAEHWA